MKHLLLALTLLTLAIPSFAQVDRATLSGVVKNSDGAVVPGATITLTNAATNVVVTQASTQGGAYLFVNLIPGGYQLDIELEGFQKSSQTVVLEVGQRALLDIVLIVGSITETVTVTERTPVLNTANASLGGVVPQTAIAGLPLAIRNWDDLLAMVPGVHIDIRLSDKADHWPVLDAHPRWYVGDLHSHSGHSDGRTTRFDGTRVRVPPVRVFEAASRAGLDFVALTDHNTASHWADVDRLQSLYPTLLLMHAREVTTYRGHANAFGERRFVNFRLDPSRPTKTLLSDLAAADAWISINHPTRPDDESCMGCGWNDRDVDTMNEVHGIEILNGRPADPLAGWRFWAEMLNRRHRLVGIGGSDEHTPDETAEGHIGHPATVIYASELSERALVDGLRRGRVYVRTRGPEGPAIELSATSDQATGAMGDTLVADGTVTLSLATERAVGQTVEWIRNGKVVETEPIGVDGRVTATMPAGVGTWFAAILRDGSGPTAFTNAIYVRTPH